MNDRVLGFSVSTEQLLFQRSVRKFLDQENTNVQLRRRMDAEAECDEALWEGLACLGVLGIVVPHEYGGSALGLVDAALVGEIFGEYAVPVSFTSHTLACLAISRSGDEKARNRWLSKLSDGILKATVALAHEGNDLKCMSATNSTKRVLSGVVMNVPFAAASDLVVVRLSDNTLCVVDTNTGGVEIESSESIDLTNRVSRLTLRDCECYFLDRTGEDVLSADQLLTAGRILLAADSSGGCQKLLAMAVSYAKMREQFGRTIEQFQAVKHSLADMAVESEPSRAFFLYVAYMFDTGIQTGLSRVAALCKGHIADQYTNLARDTVEIHGGIGFTWECDVQIWFRRAMFNRVSFGNPVELRCIS